MTLFFRGSNSKKVLKHEKKIGIETLFPQPIFVVLGRELLPKFSIMTKIFLNYFDGLPAFVTQFYSVSIREKVLKFKKNIYMSKETLFSPVIFVV